MRQIFLLFAKILLTSNDTKINKPTASQTSPIFRYIIGTTFAAIFLLSSFLIERKTTRRIARPVMAKKWRPLWIESGNTAPKK